MSLFKQYSGNMYDKDGVLINTGVHYKGYHKQTGKWSSWYDCAGEYQYNINLGDAVWLTQDGTAATGDNIILVFETQETDPINRQFCIYETSVTAVGTLVQDIQLKLAQPANVNGLWHLSSTTDGTTQFTDVGTGNKINIGRIGDTVTATTNFNNDYTWSFHGATMAQHISYFGQTIFADRLGIANINFDWLDNGVDDWAATATNIYSVISPIVTPMYNAVRTKVVNLHGDIVIDTLWIQLRYNTPVAGLSWTPTTPSVLDTFRITNITTDINSRITMITYKMDGSTLFTNTNKSYSWTQNLGTTFSPAHTLELDIGWNDGFNTQSITYTKTVTMVNLPPSFTLTETVNGDPTANDVTFTPSNLVDPDGPSSSIQLKWMIEFKTPFDNTYKTVYNPGYPTTPDLTPKEWVFNNEGTYRISATAKDVYGLETTQSIIVTFNSSADCQGSGYIRLNNNNWQLIAIPIKTHTVGEYFINKVTAAVQALNPSKTATDVIEVASAYPGQVNKFLSFIPGFTLLTSDQNFSLMMSDGTSVNEITAFWVKCNNYYTFTNNTDIVIEWSQTD